MRQRLPATGTQRSCDAMAKRDKRVRIAGRQLWTAIGFAVCPRTKDRLYFVLRPAPCIILIWLCQTFQQNGKPQRFMLTADKNLIELYDSRFPNK